MSNVEKRVEQLGLKLPERNRKGRGTCRFKISGDLLFITGTEPTGEDGNPAFVGRVGSDLTLEEGYKAGRLVGINMLTTIQDALGDLDRVDYFIKCMALVSAPVGFTQLPEVANGFTDLMTEVFGERGMHARSAMGASVLNNNVPIICDAIIKIRD